MAWWWTGPGLNAERFGCIQVCWPPLTKKPGTGVSVRSTEASNLPSPKYWKHKTQDKTKLMKQGQWKIMDFSQLRAMLGMHFAAQVERSSLFWFSNRMKTHYSGGWSFKANWWKFRGKFGSILETNKFLISWTYDHFSLSYEKNKLQSNC